MQDELKAAFRQNCQNSKMILNLALSYSGRWELVEAVKDISDAGNIWKDKTQRDN